MCICTRMRVVACACVFMRTRVCVFMRAHLGCAPAVSAVDAAENGQGAHPTNSSNTKSALMWLSFSSPSPTQAADADADADAAAHIHADTRADVRPDVRPNTGAEQAADTRTDDQADDRDQGQGSGAQPHDGVSLGFLLGPFADACAAAGVAWTIPATTDGGRKGSPAPRC